MNGKVNADIKSIKFIYERNKLFILPVAIMLICIFLLFQFVIPQFKSYLAVQEETKEALLKLDILEKNLNILANTNEEILDSQLKILSLALPLGKDFSGILNSIYYSSQASGVDLGSFSLQIGNLSSSESTGKFPTISVSIPVNGNVKAVNSFVETISNSVPLSEVSFIKVGDTLSTISLSFYYKPLGSSSAEDVPLNPLSQKGLELIDKLSGFGNIN